MVETKFDKSYVKNCIEEVVPLVEEESKLKCNLKNFGVILLSKSRLEEYTKIEDSFGGYVTGTNLFLLFNEPIGNEEATKLVLGHEVTHHAQDNSFPNFYDGVSVLEKQRKIKHDRLSPLMKLIEGDATFIERKLKEKYFKHAMMSIGESPMAPYEFFQDLDYLSWAETLRKKFNGNRRDINELYTAPIEELVKIFGE